MSTLEEVSGNLKSSNIYNRSRVRSANDLPLPSLWVWNSEFRILGSGVRDQDAGFRVQSAEFRV
jgi:hypothetical protein